VTIDEARALLGEEDTFTLFADGFDEAFIGLGRRNHQWIAIYSEPLAIKKLALDFTDTCMVCAVGFECIEDHWSDAREYFEFNVVGAYVGEGTPLWLDHEAEALL